MTDSKLLKPALAAALEKNSEAKQIVEQSEHELAMVHAVLDREVPQTGRQRGIGQAVNATQQVEEQLMKSVALLDDVNHTLLTELSETKNGA